MPFPISVRSHLQSWEIRAGCAGPTLLDFLHDHEIPIRSSCAGKGLCRQCRVRVNKGLAPITTSDRQYFSESDLKSGWRLSCQLRPKAGLQVEFPQIYQMGNHLQKHRNPVSPWWLAIDLGTTGIEMAAIDQEGEWARIKASNTQITMGSDVMTRLELAQRRGTQVLHDRLLHQFQGMVLAVKKALSQEPLAPDNFSYLNEAWVAGNSVMISFLHNWPIESLAVSPFQPHLLSAQSLLLPEIGQGHSLPLLNSFVGGDIFAGLYALWVRGEMNRAPWILMDVGTNSEIVFWTGEQLWVTSTPAGPAFEGANISIGMRAESGAIINPHWKASGSWEYEVIGGDIPKGICGSSLVGALAEALKARLISWDGEIVNDQSLCFLPELCLSQEDVREFQLAKAAIRTGLELVMSKAQKKSQRLFLAGAFGEHLPLDAAFALGLLPSMEVETLGNSSLNGTIAWGQSTPSQREEFHTWLKQHKKPVELALEDDFQKLFIEHLNFPQRKEVLS